MKFSTRLAVAATFVAAGASANAALTTVSPDCNLSVLSPSYFDCGGSFAGNNQNQEADVLAYIPDTATGTLTFDFAIDQAFVLTLKAGNQFSLFYFDGSGPAISSIDYSTLGVNVNNQGVANGLSHATIYAGNLVPGIPEPETYALMLAGLGAVGFMARRRRAN
jgi:hypothetical protein